MRKVHKSSPVMEHAPVEAAHSPAQRVDLRARAGALAPSEFRRARSQPAQSFIPAYLRLRDVLRITSLSRSTIYRRIGVHRFPSPVHLGGRACGWSAAATDDQRGALNRGRPPKYRKPKAR